MMRSHAVLAMLALSVALAPLAAQTVSPPPVPERMVASEPRLFTSSVEIEAMITRARAAIRPDQPAVFQPILQLAPYRASLEYRRARAPAAVHRDDAEYFYVVRGAGELVAGGELLDPMPGAGPNFTAKAISGGTVRHVAAGDVFIVPQNTPHQFDKIEGELVMITMRIPMPPAPKP